MDQQLKQRLIGVTIVVALIVIFVPMLFDKSEDRGKFNVTGIPAVPDEVLEKPLELPKSAEDLAPKEAEESATAQEETGYRIVPLNDEPAPAPAVSARKATTSADQNVPAESTDAAPDEGTPAGTVGKAKTATREARPTETAATMPMPATAKPGKPREAGPAATSRAAEPRKTTESTAVKPSATRPAPTPVPKSAAPSETRTAQPAKTETAVPKPKMESALPARAVEASQPKKLPESARKTEVTKSAESRQATGKPAKPKSSPLLPEADKDDDFPIPAPAKAEVPSVKSRPAAAPAAKTAEPVAKIREPSKKPEDANAAEDVARSAAKTPKAETDVPVTKPRPVKPAVSKASPEGTKPTKAAEDGKAKPKAKASGWVIQAGSFTEESSARNLVDKLKQSKFPAYMETVRGANGTVYRVQVGSESDRSRAEDTLKQIEGSTGINGIITPRR